MARFVDKSQLDSNCPLGEKGTLSVCPSIKIEMSGFSSKTEANSRRAFFPWGSMFQRPDLNRSLFSMET